MRLFLALLLMLASAQAFAQSCNGNPNNCDQGQAYMAAVSLANTNGPAMCKTIGTPTTTYTGHNVTQAGSDSYLAGIKCSNGANGANVGTTYFVNGQTCSTRGPTTGGWVLAGAGGKSCNDGCAYGGASGGTSITINGKTYLSKAGATPTGEVCSGTDENVGASGQCTQVSGLTQCVTADGKHCTVASSGKRFCWNPKETGTKVSSNEAATKSPSSVAVNNPPVPPKNNGQWVQTGSGTASVTSGGSTTTYNVTNHTSNYGNEGSGGGAEGEGGDGEGEGEGDGQPEWTKGDEPAREDEGPEDDVTDFGIGVSPDLLDREEIFGGGSCPSFPSFKVMGVTINPSDIPQWCTWVSIMRAAVLLMAGFAALRILTGDGL